MDFKDSNAIYLQIADFICENILLKKWKNGDRIPSVRELAVSMEVNPNTAMRTFTYLQDQGIIFNKRGIGYFISDEGFKKTLKLKKDTFIKEDMPEFIKSMKLLGITPEEIKQYFDEFKSS